MNARRLQPQGNAATQKGIATLLIALVLLVILTLIVLGSSNVALFEQKTATNENRQNLTEAAAEYALNLGGEYLKANVVNVASNEDANGWLTSGGANLHWQPCPANPTDPKHPCNAEGNSGRRAQLYYYTTDGTAVTNSTSVKLNLPYNSLLPSTAGGPRLSKAGGGVFDASSTVVRALLCRLDTTAGATPSCQSSPTTGNRIAITLISTSGLANENSAATVKETWGTYTSFSTQASVPLVAAGLIKGLGNASIVTAPNAGGYGLAGSMWSPNNADVDGSGPSGGVGSVTTCHMGDYLGTVPAANLTTTCAGQGNTGCSCGNVATGSPDMLSGHFGGTYKQESADTLDVDLNHGGRDIQFFPGKTSAGVRMDHQAAGSPAVCATNQPYCMTDDNMFEWIFGQDVNGGDADGYPVNAGGGSWRVTSAIAAAELGVLNNLGAEVIADCSGLDTNSSGLYYVTGACSLKSDVGSASDPVVVVADGDVKIAGNFTYFGMLFIRDASAGASLKGVGNVNIFGSVVVEGDVDVAGGLSIIYLNTSTGTPGKKLKPTTRFARLPGSWLDSRTAF